MSIFFYHVALAFFPLAFFLSFLRANSKEIFLPAIFGIFFGFLVFITFLNAATTDIAKIFFDIFCIILLLIVPFSFKFKNSYFIVALSFLLALCYGFDYKFISLNFNIFAGELLDSLSLSNLFMLLFGCIVFICFFYLLRAIFKGIRQKFQLILFLIVLVLLVIDRLGFATLSLMQTGMIKTYSGLLSIVAKVIYADSFLPIILCILAFIAAIAKFELIKPLPDRADIINFRIIKAQKFKILSEFGYAFMLGIIVISLVLYYLLIASKPPQIDDPQIIEPQNGEFRFNAEIIKDNKLHRFAYITDDGHKVRFFLLNRFPDKVAPVVVFDSCSICGDMGYIKENENLICVSCNVRIFLPSVGKPGGCNPIPLEYKFDGEFITIPLDVIEKGSVYFSQIVEKIVTDPVSRAKIKNSSKFSYLYYGRTYFFESEKNQAEFEANPEKYVNINGVLKEIK